MDDERKIELSQFYLTLGMASSMPLDARIFFPLTRYVALVLLSTLSYWVIVRAITLKFGWRLSMHFS